MRKIVMVLSTMVFVVLLFSCTDNDLSENELLYETQATEGEDGETEDSPNS